MVPIQWYLNSLSCHVISLDFASYGELQMQLANQASQ